MADVISPGAEIRAVVLDLDGTLYRQGPVRRAMVARLARAYWREPASAVRVARILGSYRGAQESLRRSGFEGDVATAQAGLAAERSSVDVSVVCQCVDRWMDTMPLDLVAASARSGLVHALDVMSNRGIKLGVVSDYPARRKLDALGITDRFTSIVCAQDPEIGVFKPHPRGILLALKQLGVAPAAALYVGDRVEVDACAASAAGVPFALIGSRHRHLRDDGIRVRDFRQLSRAIEHLTT